MFIHEVIEALDIYKVRYALIGGFAVALHGAVRATVDIDFVISLSEKSFAAAEKAMFSLGLRPRLPITAQDVFLYRQEYIRNRNLIAWAFVHPSNAAQAVDFVIIFDVDKIKIVNKKLGNLNVKIASIRDLIQMKKKAGRPQDLEDAKSLEYLLK